ncbi:hypothetical protein [Clostridium sp. D33t1_170424_F3]|uniref:hypothetical protein n=1 Tax=Clostridium sp. D33t1_170424_F3 TaxID=2787099 RepID=UPI0018A914CC|nr:hypothetical protein [Clostridium sp. D33t1_170424_F3]
MKICLVNGSPKKKGSASGWFIAELQKLLPAQAQTAVLESASYTGKPFLEQLCDCDALVFVFPLYVDAAPSHLVRILTELEAVAAGKKQKPVVYTVVNCGFFETKQNRYALQIMRHFCRRAGFPWGEGVAVGGGGFLGQSVGIPLDASPKKSLCAAFTAFAASIAQGKTGGEDRYVEPNIPRFLYFHVANYGWKRQGKQNGLGKKALYRTWEKKS